MDRQLFDFVSLTASGVADPNGDIAFDEEPCATPADSAVIRLQLDE